MARPVRDLAQAMFRLPKCGLTIAGRKAVTAAGPATAAGQRVGSPGRGEASADLALIEASSAALTACSVLARMLPEEPTRS